MLDFRCLKQTVCCKSFFVRPSKDNSDYTVRCSCQKTVFVVYTWLLVNGRRSGTSVCEFCDFSNRLRIAGIATEHDFGAATNGRPLIVVITIFYLIQPRLFSLLFIVRSERIIYPRRTRGGSSETQNGMTAVSADVVSLPPLAVITQKKFRGIRGTARADLTTIIQLKVPETVNHSRTNEILILSSSNGILLQDVAAGARFMTPCERTFVVQ